MVLMSAVDMVTVSCSATELQDLSTASLLRDWGMEACTGKSGLDLKIKHL